MPTGVYVRYRDGVALPPPVKAKIDPHAPLPCGCRHLPKRGCPDLDIRTLCLKHAVDEMRDNPSPY